MTDEERKQYEAAMNTLYLWTYELAEYAAVTTDEVEAFWKELITVPGLLREYAYFHDTGEVLCEYKINGYTVADVMVWQIDHFRAHMDRVFTNNKNNKNKLTYETFKIMLQIRRNPEILRSLENETGTDLTGGWTI